MRKPFPGSVLSVFSVLDRHERIPSCSFCRLLQRLFREAFGRHVILPPGARPFRVLHQAYGQKKCGHAALSLASLDLLRPVGSIPFSSLTDYLLAQTWRLNTFSSLTGSGTTLPVVAPPLSWNKERGQPQ